MLNQPLYALYTMLGVLGLLGTASFVNSLLPVFKNNINDNELNLRIQSWWWMIGLLFIALCISTEVTIIFFGLLSFFALKEFFSIVPTRQCDRRVVFWAYASIPIQYYWINIGWYEMFIIFIPVYMLLFLPMRMVFIGETKGFIRSAGILQWGTLLTVFCLSHVAYLVKLPVLNEKAGSIGLVLFLLLMTQLNDVSQYIFGKMLGRHKIIPKISPNKTVEGFLGGLITVALGSSFIAPFLTPFNWQHGLIIGAIIAFAGFIGDVVISAIKRDLQIKDSGKLIPGHGGILDRLDSLTYTTPIFFHYLYYFYY